MPLEEISFLACEQRREKNVIILLKWEGHSNTGDKGERGKFVSITIQVIGGRAGGLDDLNIRAATGNHWR